MPPQKSHLELWTQPALCSPTTQHSPTSQGRDKGRFRAGTQRTGFPQVTGAFREPQMESGCGRGKITAWCSWRASKGQVGAREVTATGPSGRERHGDPGQRLGTATTQRGQRGVGSSCKGRLLEVLKGSLCWHTSSQG